MDKPLITIHEPVRRGDRWTARAEIRAKGEHIELSATASDRLATRARDWYDRAAARVAEWVQYEGAGELGRGVFAELPEVAHQLAQSPIAIPYDEEIEDAAALFGACSCGDPAALEQAARIYELAPQDETAARAWEKLQLIDAVVHSRAALPLASVFAGAGTGDPLAHQMLAALRATRPPSSAPIQLGYHVEDYVEHRDRLGDDLAAAAHEELGARVVAPYASTVRRVRPSYQAPMLRAYQQLLAAYAW